MSINKPKPIFKVAKDLNLSTRTLHARLMEGEFKVPRDPNYKITSEMYEFLTQYDFNKKILPSKKNKRKKRNKKHRIPEHSLTINGYPVDIYTTYYPKNRNRYVSKKAIQDRELVYNLKKGVLDKSHINILSGLLNRHFNGSFQNVLLCCIPASTIKLNRFRYKQLFIDVCSKNKILNGYGAITRNKDRESMKELGHNLNRIEGVKFKKETLEGRDVVLFDDVLTTGKSFTQFSEVLSDINVKSVYGIMLGKSSSGKKSPVKPTK